MDSYDFEEDEEPTWLVKQREEAEELAEKLNSRTARTAKKTGDQVGRFIFVERHWHFKHKHFYLCPICDTKFIGHDSNIKTKKNCKYCKRKGFK